jgi:hypothetical protein
MPGFDKRQSGRTFGRDGVSFFHAQTPLKDTIMPKPNCIYCGKPTKKGKEGEHIVQEAIGGSLTLLDISDREVCQPCNNEALGDIDKEFTSKSYLSIVASQEIGAYLGQCWNVDHSSGKLLIEARPVWVDGLMSDCICYPQLTFEKEGLAIRGDANEMNGFGFDNFSQVLKKAAKSAYRRLMENKKPRAIHLERVETGLIEENRFAPRLFSTKPIQQIAESIDSTSFTLRYLYASDKKFALHNLEKMSEEQQFNNRKTVFGSFTPRISFSFNVLNTIRGLMKIGVNLVAGYCPNTPINPKSCEAAMEMVLGKIQVSRLLMNTNGFVVAEGIQSIAAPDKAHSFRLVNINNIWHVYSSFFGGRIGGYVQFPGPNKESWNTLDVVAPLRSKDWKTTESNLYLVLDPKVEWNESAKLCPTLKIHSSRSVMRAELVPIKKPKNK